MRILALTNLYPNPYQPHRAPFNRQQLRALAAHHDVSVIAPIAWTEELSIRRRVGERLPATRRITFDGIPVDHPRYYFPPKVFRRWYGRCFRHSVRPTFWQALEEFRPEVLLAAWAYPDGWAGVEFAREAGIPVAVKVHGSDVLLLDATPARRRATFEALDRADQIIAVSDDLRRKIVSSGVSEAKVNVVYCGINTDLFHPGPRDEARARLGLAGNDPLVLFVGNLLPVKGLDVLIDACERLDRRGVAFECRLVGQGPLKRRLEAWARRAGLSGRVSLVGPRPMEQLPDWYRAADLFVLPSRSEGVPNVLMEAVACGTPVVATRVGGIPEVTGPGYPGLVPAEDAEALAVAIEAALAGARHPIAGQFRPQTWDDSAAALAGVLAGLN